MANPWLHENDDRRRRLYSLQNRNADFGVDAEKMVKAWPNLVHDESATMVNGTRQRHCRPTMTTELGAIGKRQTMTDLFTLHVAGYDRTTKIIVRTYHTIVRYHKSERRRQDHEAKTPAFIPPISACIYSIERQVVCIILHAKSRPHPHDHRIHIRQQHYFTSEENNNGRARHDA